MKQVCEIIRNFASVLESCKNEQGAKNHQTSQRG